MAQELRVLLRQGIGAHLPAPLLEDPQLPIRPTSGDPIPLSSLRRLLKAHAHSHAETHIRMQSKLKIKYLFKKNALEAIPLVFGKHRQERVSCKEINWQSPSFVSQLQTMIINIAVYLIAFGIA